MDARDRHRGCLLGLACGDAVGTTVEFMPRGSFDPVVDMVGGGPFGLAAGEWTDDTSMALCLATSLVERGGFDAHDQMERYRCWARDGYLSSNGTCFDIGNTVAAALRRFGGTGDPWAGSTDRFTAGNGSIMRLAPVAMFFAPDAERAVRHAADSSRTTHAAAECVDACRLLAAILVRALEGRDAHDVLLASADEPWRSEAIGRIASGAYLDAPRDDVRGTGYVVDSLEAALWCFARADSFEEAVLLAANLGDDADTTAAVTGQVAGAFHGVDAIPARWLEHLALRDDITRLADALHDAP